MYLNYAAENALDLQIILNLNRIINWIARNLFLLWTEE